MLLNPHQQTFDHLDPVSKELMLKTVAFFEDKGKKKLKEDDHERVWNYDFVEFVKQEKAFATLLTPAGYGAADSRWDTYRICAYNEILGFYGLCYWYTWQVSMLGLGPIWMSQNETVKQKTARLLQEGAVFAFGLYEKEHGADLYASEMLLTPVGSDYRADGTKYYIGNANEAALVSTFGKMADSGDYVFFVVDSQHGKFECVKNIVNSQNYVAEFALHSYPVSEEDILSLGRGAWDASLNTINICKYNLGWASIGMCTHALYEAITHAAHRRLFNHYVTDFPHIKQLFTDAYARLIAMKLFALRAADYMRSASTEDRRYLLYNPLVKMKVTTQGEEVVNLLWDVIAAKGFEKDMFFEMVTRDIRALPKLEGTVHVNMALVVKFMPNYFFFPAEFPAIPRRDDVADDTFLFNQGPTKGLGKIQFHNYVQTYDSVDLPNVHIFKEQIAVFKEMLFTARPTEEQIKDIDFLLNLGELFTLVVYGQLIIENARIYEIEDDLLDQIFDFMIRDFSKFALQVYSKTSSNEQQMAYCLKMIRKPTVNQERFQRIWQQHVYALADTYEMSN
jgi:acyl-CoA dehydrogenase